MLTLYEESQADLQYARRNSRKCSVCRKKERSRHTKFVGSGFRQAALAMDALSARGGCGAQVR